ncbi:hypothetical protein P8452_76457 [Trifolium repens]|nr:hypothetical protein P8452_76457 [Trifolium repens]
MKAAHLYILLNCPEVVPYLNMYSDLLRELDPELNELDLDKQVSTTFPTWFNTYVRDSRNGINDVLLKSLAWGPIRYVIKWSSYVINEEKEEEEEEEEKGVDEEEDEWEEEWEWEEDEDEGEDEDEEVYGDTDSNDGFAA